MTLSQLQKRVEALQRELNSLRIEIARLKGADFIPGIGPIGTFRDDPTFEEAVRLGREYRDQINRESLEQLDREEMEQRKKQKPKARKRNARV